MSKTANPVAHGEILPATIERRILPRASRQPRPDSHVLALEELRVHGLERAVVLGTGLLVASTLTWGSLDPSAGGRRQRRRDLAGGRAGACTASRRRHRCGSAGERRRADRGGQPLLRMNDAAAQSELSQARLRLESLQLQAQRLAAAANGNLIAMELRGRQIPMAGMVADATGTQVAPLLTTSTFAEPQRTALTARMRALADRISVLQEQVAQRRGDLATLSGQISSLQEQTALHSKELGIREELARTGLTTVSPYWRRSDCS